LIEVVSIKFNEKGKIYFFSPNGLSLRRGDHAVVETAKGIEYGECAYGNHEVDESIVVPPLRPIIRLATPADDKRAVSIRDHESEDMLLCQSEIDKLGLPMKLVSVEYSFDGTLITFFFTADGRVDFRKLVWELNTLFAPRVKLIQIGVRDQAKLIGGLGICGKQFCCSQFLRDFHPVSIKMAKTQGLSLNPVKISGTCGKLMCCLKYEEEAYEELVKLAPRIDSFVETPYGKGSVVGVNLLRGVAKVRLEDGGDMTQKSVPFDELDVLGGKARRAEYQAAKAEGKLEEAGFKPSVIRKAAPLIIPDILPPVPAAKEPQKRGAPKRSAKNPAPAPAPANAPRETAADRPAAPQPKPAKRPAPRKNAAFRKRRQERGS
jgi:cell fate regulator YaaT (PSP1 superfamily)